MPIDVPDSTWGSRANAVHNSVRGEIPHLFDEPVGIERRNIEMGKILIEECAGVVLEKVVGRALSPG